MGLWLKRGDPGVVKEEGEGGPKVVTLFQWHRVLFERVLSSSAKNEGRRTSIMRIDFTSAETVYEIATKEGKERVRDCEVPRFKRWEAVTMMKGMKFLLEVVCAIGIDISA